MDHGQNLFSVIHSFTLVRPTFTPHLMYEVSWLADLVRTCNFNFQIPITIPARSYILFPIIYKYSRNTTQQFEAGFENRFQLTLYK